MYCVTNNNKSQTLAQHLSVYHSEFLTENEFLKKSQKRNQKQNKCIYKLNKMQIAGQYMYTGYNIAIKIVLIFSIRGEFVF